MNIRSFIINYLKVCTKREKFETGSVCGYIRNILLQVVGTFRGKIIHYINYSELLLNCNNSSICLRNIFICYNKRKYYNCKYVLFVIVLVLVINVLHEKIK